MSRIAMCKKIMGRERKWVGEEVGAGRAEVNNTCDVLSISVFTFLSQYFHVISNQN